MDSAGEGWLALTWEGLEAWAGSRAVARGRDYQRRGRVKDVVVSAAGRVLATVEGGEEYVTSVWLAEGSGLPESACTCPVGASGCKHAVAVAAEYLELLGLDSEVPAAGAEDPRWAELAEGAPEEEEGGDEGMEEDAAGRPRRRGGERTVGSWGERISRHLDGLSREELVALVQDWGERHEAVREELRERVALGDGNVDRLVKEARQELKRATASPGWRNNWTGEGHTPEFGKLEIRLKRLVELGHSDAVAGLGEEILERGLKVVEISDDEGETAAALGRCLDVVFEAVAGARLAPERKLLFVVNASLKDEYDVIGDGAAAVWKREFTASDWASVAKVLAKRLEAAEAGDEDDSFSSNYRRDGISGWLGEALAKAGREEEVSALYEREARVTGSYPRLVEHLLKQERYGEAAKWALEGIGKTREKLPGVARSLAALMCESARRQGQWDVVAAHEAWAFFERPGKDSFGALVAAAEKAGCGEAVRRAAMEFLQTGILPTGTGCGGKAGGKGNWPLATPEYLRALSRGAGRTERARPHHGVLIEMALAAGCNDEALRWYDALSKERKSSGRSAEYGWGGYDEQVAGAVTKSHPERAAGIYREMLESSLARTGRGAYDVVGGYLRTMRPILQGLGREKEWESLVGEIRTRYRNRPRLLEVLDGVEGKTVVQSQRDRR